MGNKPSGLFQHLHESGRFPCYRIPPWATAPNGDSLPASDEGCLPVADLKCEQG